MAPNSVQPSGRWPFVSAFAARAAFFESVTAAT
jgi:hypothetical protein